MDESAIVSNKILEIIEKPLAERDVNLYIEKATRYKYYGHGLLALRVDEGPDLVEKISIIYSYRYTDIHGFEPEAFPQHLKMESTRIQICKNIGNTNLATNYDFCDAIWK